jgi:voltage-gated potassium channel
MVDNEGPSPSVKGRSRGSKRDDVPRLDSWVPFGLRVPSAIVDPMTDTFHPPRWTQRLKDTVNSFIDRHEVAWELGFGALAIVFVGLAFVEPANESQLMAIIATEWMITGIYALEFFGRLWAAPSRRSYLRGHAIDLISVIPPTRWLRPFRLVRLLRLVRTFAGVSRAMAHGPKLAKHRGLIWLFGAWAAVMVLASTALYIAENGVNEAIANPFDALWWGVSTLSTVGYGDVIPTTTEGRIAAMILMVLGIGLFSAITAAVTSYFVSQDGGGSTVGDLERLVSLQESGTLTPREFATAKAKVLGLTAPRDGPGDRDETAS